MRCVLAPSEFEATCPFVPAVGVPFGCVVVTIMCRPARSLNYEYPKDIRGLCVSRVGGACMRAPGACGGGNELRDWSLMGYSVGNESKLLPRAFPPTSSPCVFPPPSTTS